MRHRVGHRKLQKTTSHRLAMLDNMVTSLLEHEAIRTTLPRAKEARRLAERVITLGKRGGLPNVRLAERRIRSRSVLHKVFGELKDRYADRPGGYTRIVRLGFRPGDAAQMALLELVDRPESGTPAPAEPKPEAKAKPKAEAKKEPKKEAKAPKVPPKAKSAKGKAED
ncbi:MAG TPA: 50S ribosomal protein L17 [Myxococcaceae bacterium]|nr:50S ribosomal protein L17 [Myxococcaceae bacterium]